MMRQPSRYVRTTNVPTAYRRRAVTYATPRDAAHSFTFTKTIIENIKERYRRPTHQLSAALGGRLYVLNYASHKAATGSGTSLRRIGADLSMEVVPETAGVDGTYANRFVHVPTNQLVIGAHVIDARHRIRTVPSDTDTVASAQFFYT